ncbi:hypothetical protein AMR72_01745 [Flavobacterium psychrophilum]|nr:hypothetical protein AMR72_01745 [Flavobacterium psychrophilum]AOE51358.1 hypothetical protein ALW18_01745 [Flavobacterium psychrophilum]
MKKQLLTGALLLASFFAAQAQVSYSFEGSEGYTVGAFVVNEETGDAQNGWGTNTPATEIVSTDATNGTNSLLIGTTNQPLSNGAFVGAYGPEFTNVAGDVDFTFDIKRPTLDATAGSTVRIAVQAPSQQLATSYVLSLPDGRFVYYDVNEEDPTALDGYLFGTISGETFTPFVGQANTWYNIRVEHLFADNLINYYLNDQLMGQSTAWGADAVENAIFVTNNLSTTALIDNVKVDGSETASVKENVLASLSVFPNPTNDVVTIANNENILVDGLSVVDLNGRTVKTVKFAGVAEAQVNLSDLSSGVYMMTISSDKGTTTKKIVKN